MTTIGTIVSAHDLQANIDALTLKLHTTDWTHPLPFHSVDLLVAFTNLKRNEQYRFPSDRTDIDELISELKTIAKCQGIDLSVQHGGKHYKWVKDGDRITKLECSCANIQRSRKYNRSTSTLVTNNLEYRKVRWYKLIISKKYEYKTKFVSF